MKKMVWMVLAALFIMGTAVICDAADASAVAWHRSKQTKITRGGFVFYSYPSIVGNECWIYKIRAKKGAGPGTTLTFPSKINGNTVTKLGYDQKIDGDDEFFSNIFGSVVEEAHGIAGESMSSARIKKIVFPKTVTEITDNAFSGFTALETVKLPDGVRTLNSSLFYGCRSLKKVRLPKNLESVCITESYNTWPGAFGECKKLSRITISPKNKNFQTKNNMILSGNGEKLVFVAPAMKTVKIPAGVKEIGVAALGNSKTETVVIPKTVSHIRRKALSSRKIKKIKLDKQNPYLVRDKNSIYNKSDKSLAVVVVNKKRQAVVSDKVEVIGEDVSVAGLKIRKVWLSKNLKRVIEDWMFWREMAVAGVKVYFRGEIPPAITSKYAGYVFTAMPIFDKVFVPEGTRKAYEKWAKDRDGLRFTNLEEF